MKALAIIPARGNSKGIPRKNLQMVAGKPLLQHTIEQAKAASAIERVAVSSDSEEILALAQKTGAVTILRPAELATDTALTEAAILHALEQMEGLPAQPVVLLQVTSPLRLPAEIDEAVSLLLEGGYDSVVSVVPFLRFLWRRVGGRAVPFNYDLLRRPRRQEIEQDYFMENGSIYVFRREGFMHYQCRLYGRMGMYVMRSETAVEVDTPTDLLLVECLMRQRERQHVAAV